MNRLIATVVMIFFEIQTLLGGCCLDVSAFYDHFRGIPDGSWNGNHGALLAINGCASLANCLGVQVGGSYGLYNWDGRGNVVFANPKKLEQIGFVTAGFYRSGGRLNGGIVYDRLFTRHYSIFDTSPSIDQLRFQVGYAFCNEEVGVWGTHYLHTTHKEALGLPVSFRAISQLNVFWSHFFQNCAETTIWAGAPYRHSLLYRNKSAGKFIVGFSIKAPLTDRLFFDGYGAYMGARHGRGVKQSRNFDASIALGVTYRFGLGYPSCCGNVSTGTECSGCPECPEYPEYSYCSGYPCCDRPYMSIANHSNFFVDTNTNQ